MSMDDGQTEEQMVGKLMNSRLMLLFSPTCFWHLDFLNTNGFCLHNAIACDN